MWLDYGPVFSSLLTTPEGIELQVLFDLFDLPTLRYLQLDHPAWNNKVYLRMYWEPWSSFPRPHMATYNSTDNALHLEKVLPHHRCRKTSVDLMKAFHLLWNLGIEVRLVAIFFL